MPLEPLLRVLHDDDPPELIPMRDAPEYYLQKVVAGESWLDWHDPVKADVDRRYAAFLLAERARL